MNVFDDIKPTTKPLVFDPVHIPGCDMAGWIGISNNPRGPKAMEGLKKCHVINQIRTSLGAGAVVSF